MILLDKPGGITVQVDETLDSFGDDYEWTFEELSVFADERTEDDGDGPPRIHVLSIDGRYVSEDGGTTAGSWRCARAAVATSPRRVETRPRGARCPARETSEYHHFAQFPKIEAGTRRGYSSCDTMLPCRG